LKDIIEGGAHEHHQHHRYQQQGLLSSSHNHIAYRNFVHSIKLEVPIPIPFEQESKQEDFNEDETVF
jgi:hypothetical protein